MSASSRFIAVLVSSAAGLTALAGADPVQFSNAVQHRSERVPDSPALPAPTIDALVARRSSRVELVGWGGPDALVLEYSEGRNRTTRRLTVTDGELGSPVEGYGLAFSPDGRSTVRYSGGEWIFADGTGRTVRVAAPASAAGRVDRSGKPVWSADGRHVALSALVQPLVIPSEPPVKTVNGVRVMDYDDLSGSTPVSTAYLTIVDVPALFAGTASAPRWHEIPERVGQMAWDRQGVYFASARFFVKQPHTIVSYLAVGADAPREVYRTPGRFQTLRPMPSPDGRLLAIGLDVDTRYWDAFVSILLVDPATGREVRRLTDSVPVLASSIQWAPDGGSVTCVVRQGGLDQLARIDLAGRVHYLTDGLRKHSNPQVSPDFTRIAYQTDDGYGRRDVRVRDLASNAERTLLVIEDPTRDFRLGQFHHVRWRSTDGISPYGYVFLPPDFDPEKKYPLIVDVHGGGAGSSLYLTAPFTISASPGPLEWHAWAALGYVVLAADYRSTGYYGPIPAVARPAADRDLMGDDVADIVSGTRFMQQQPFIDPARTALIGHSAGGGRAYLLMTQHPDLFRAAVVNEGAAPDPMSTMLNLSTGSFTGREFEGIMTAMVGAPLAAAPDRYKRNVIFDSHRIRTATLIMLGSEKLGGIYQVPHQVLYSILRAYGTPTRLLSFVDEGHNYSRPESARHAFMQVRDWFAHHLAGPANPPAVRLEPAPPQ